MCCIAHVSVHGTAPTVNRMCDHPDIKAISFVGGDNAGKHIYNRSARLTFKALHADLKRNSKWQAGASKHGGEKSLRDHARW